VERAKFEELCRELEERSLSVCEETLDKVGLASGDMTQVVATGGMSRVPLVRDTVSRFFGREPLSVVSPDEAVALGAGIRAAQRVHHAVRGVFRNAPPP